jgi:hypothetical protein
MLVDILKLERLKNMEMVEESGFAGNVSLQDSPSKIPHHVVLHIVATVHPLLNTGEVSPNSVYSEKQTMGFTEATRLLAKERLFKMMENLSRDCNDRTA